MKKLLLFSLLLPACLLRGQSLNVTATPAGALRSPATFWTANAAAIASAAAGAFSDNSIPLAKISGLAAALAAKAPLASPAFTGTVHIGDAFTFESSGSTGVVNIGNTISVSSATGISTNLPIVGQSLQTNTVLYDASQNPIIDMTSSPTRLAIGEVDTDTINLSNLILTGAIVSGSEMAMDFNTAEINSEGQPSVDVGQRLLKDTGGAVALTWGDSKQLKGEWYLETGGDLVWPCNNDNGSVYLYGPQNLSDSINVYLPDSAGTLLVNADASAASAANKLLKMDGSGKIDPGVLPTDNLAIALQRGTEAEIDSVTLGSGVPAWATDTGRLTVGDATTGGGNMLRKIAGYTFTPDDGESAETVSINTSELDLFSSDGTHVESDDLIQFDSLKAAGGGVTLVLGSNVSIASNGGVELHSAGSGTPIGIAQGLRFGDNSHALYRESGEPSSGLSTSSYCSLTIGGNLRYKRGFIQSTSSITGAGAISIQTAGVWKLTTTGASQALTLADGTEGETITIIHVVDGGDATLTPATKTGYSSITFTAVGDSVTLVYLTTYGWMVTASHGATVNP